MLFTLLRMKVFAVVLGKEGVGVMSLLTVVWELGFLIGGLGISQSGVRFLSEARSKNDPERIRYLRTIIKKIVFVSGIFTVFVFIIFRNQISDLTFNSTDFGLVIGILGIGVLFQIFAEGEKSIILGYREVKKLAVGNGVGIISGTIIGVLLVLFFKSSGLVWVILATALCTWIALFFQQRSINQNATAEGGHGREDKTIHSSSRYAIPLVQLGLVLVASSVLASSVSFITRIWIVDNEASLLLGKEAAGLYDQAFRVSAFYVNFVLGAMAADFLPRLTEVISSPDRRTQTVNEQIEVGVLLIIPGIIGLILFREPILYVLASKEFLSAGPLIIWFACGCLGRVITWPIAYLFVAAEKKITFFAVELGVSLANVALAWILVRKYGALGGAAAFGLIYVIYGICVTAIANKQFNFRPNKSVIKIVSVSIICAGLAITFGIYGSVMGFWYYAVSLVFSLVVGFFSLKEVVSLLPDGHSWKIKLERLPFVS